MATLANPKIGTQIIGAIAATMGGFSYGTVLGWSSPAQGILTKMGISSSQFAHISSIVFLGAAVTPLFMYFTFDKIGRKWTMIIIEIPMIIMWILMAFLNYFPVFLLGRFGQGFCGAVYLVTASSYIGEFASKNIRGFFMINFNLLLIGGILYSYILGIAENLHLLCLPMIMQPVLCIGMMVFMPESPVLLMMKNKKEKAKEALIFYRGKDFNVTQDLESIENYIGRCSESNFLESMRKKENKRAFMILIGLHTIQKLSGLHIVISYAAKVFRQGSFFGLSENASTCILATTRIMASAAAACLVDKLGRRMLWLISLSIMFMSLVVIGTFLTIKAHYDNLTGKVEFILVPSFCLYMIGVSFGVGPLPYGMLGELLSANVKKICGPIISAYSSMLAYVVILSYPHLAEALGIGFVFLGYSVICILGIFFGVFCFIETKGKSLEEVQIELTRKRFTQKSDNNSNDTGHA